MCWTDSVFLFFVRAACSVTSRVPDTDIGFRGKFQVDCHTAWPFAMASFSIEDGIRFGKKYQGVQVVSPGIKAIVATYHRDEKIQLESGRPAVG